MSYWKDYVKFLQRDIVSPSLPCFVLCLDSLLLIHMVANKPQAPLRNYVILLEMEETYMVELNQNKVISNKLVYILPLSLRNEWDSLLRRSF